MSDLIPLAKLNTESDEPRVLDLDLAAWLGLSQPRNVRTVIVANLEELEMHGSLHVASANPGIQGGRPGKAYWLNEGQALVICALSRTPTAAKVRKAVIEVFMAYRQGKLVHVKEHRRRLPTPIDHAWEAENRALQRFRNNPEALIEVLARCVIRLDRLERT